MKKIFTLLLSFFLYHLASAQLLVEDFNFSGLLTDHGWTKHSGTSEPISTTTGLVYSGYAGSGIGNAANIVGASEDVNRDIAEQSGDGTTIYMSFLVNVTETTNQSGGYFMHLGDRSSATSFTAFCARVFAKTVDGVVNFGLGNTSTGIYAPGNYLPNTTYLIIVKYTISTAGSDPVSMWIRSAGVPQTEADAGTPDITVTDQSGYSSDIVDAIGLRQASSIPDVVVDGIRIANTWSEAVLPLKVLSFNYVSSPNAVGLRWTTADEINVDKFSIEKKDGVSATYASIGEVKAYNTPGTHEYSFSDNKILTPQAFYRLAIIDKDGTVAYYGELFVNNTVPAKITVFPNPVVNGNLVLSHPTAVKGAILDIVSYEGKKVASYPILEGAIQTNVNISTLPKGSYVVVLHNGNNRQSVKFIKQ